MPAFVQSFINVVIHNQQHHAGRTFTFLGVAVLLGPVSALFGYMHWFTASSIVLTVALLAEFGAILQNFCPCGCSKKTREMLNLTPSKESRRLVRLESRKVALRIIPSYFALIALTLLPFPKAILGVAMLSLFIGFGAFLIYFGNSKKGQRFLIRPLMLRYKDLTVHDFADWSDKELEGLIEHGLMTGALDGANLVSKFVLKKTELMYLTDSERNAKPLQSETASEADQATAA